MWSSPKFCLSCMCSCVHVHVVPTVDELHELLQMSMRHGVVFNPEALELFGMNKVFIVYSWLKQQNHAKPRLKTADMAKMLGFGIGDELFDLIEKYPVDTE